MLKAIREAKVNTTWTDSDPSYANAVSAFVAEVLSGPDAGPFLKDLLAFQRRLARIGVVHSLSQVLLKIASPGIPDIYQGCELWDFSLVDPDNRRPVDYEARAALLSRIRGELSSIGSELAVSSYKFFVHDGLTLDPVRNRGLYEQLNTALYPLTYRDLRQLSDFQNRVYAKYARTRGLPFIDVAPHMPDNVDLYMDSVHFSYGGVRLHAWIVLQALVPLIESKIAEGAWPMPAHHPKEAPPGLYFQPRSIPVSCPADAKGR